MSVRDPSRPVRYPPLATNALVGLVGGFLGYLTGLPDLAGVGVVLAGVGVAAALRSQRSPRPRAAAPVPLLLALAFAALACPLGLVPELAAGAAGLAFLVWLADDPARFPGGVGRARTTLLVPALALGIAWASSLILPATAAPLGVAAGVLVVALAALAYLFARPSLFDREGAATY